MRGKLLLIHSLGKIQDEQAGAVLQVLFGGEDPYSFQREIVMSLGQRQDAASLEVLRLILETQTDPQLRFAAAQALKGRADALSWITKLFQTESSLDVQKELIRSIGAVGNDAAKRVLADIAQGTGGVHLREAAIQELRRSFGAGALGVLEPLLNDPDPDVRQNAAAAVAGLRNN